MIMKMFILFILCLTGCDFGIATIESSKCIQSINRNINIDMITGKQSVTYDTTWQDCTKGSYNGPVIPSLPKASAKAVPNL